MAKVKMGIVVVGIRGTIGGLTFSANRAGNHARAWSKSANARSSLQSGRRVILSVAAQGWRGLTDINRQDWDTLAAVEPQYDAFGVEYFLSGFQRYVRFQSWLKTVGRAATTGPTLEAAPAAPTVTGFQVSKAASTCHFHYAANEFGATWDAVVFVGVGAGHGNIVAPGPMPLIIGSQVPGGTSLVFTTEFMAVFGSVTVNQRVFFAVHRQSITGSRSAPATGWADVVA